MKQMLIVMSLALLAAMGQAEDKETAYLGVTVGPVEDGLRTQLKLPSGVGLLVEYVDENGPSAKVLEKHDVLHKFDDQLLFNREQFQSLLHTHQPGEIVALTVIRDGQSRPCAVQLGGRIQKGATGGSRTGNNSTSDSALAGVPDEIAEAMRLVLGRDGTKLGKGLPQVSVMVSSNISAVAPGMPQISTQISTQISIMISTNASASASAYSSSSSSSKSSKSSGNLTNKPHLLGNHGFRTNSVTRTKPGAGSKVFSSVNESTASSRVYMKSNERGTFTLNCTDGKKTFTATSKDGKTLFSGPVNNDEECDKLPDELKKELDALEKNTKPAETM